MLGSKVIRFLPYQTSTAADVMGEIAVMMKNANPQFRYQCPTADIDCLLANQVPREICLFVDDPRPKSGPQPDKDFITTFRTDIFSDVVVSEVSLAVPLPNKDGVRFSDYTMIVLTETGITPVSKSPQSG